MEIQGIITAALACEVITGKIKKYLTVSIPVGADDGHPSGYTAFDAPIYDGKVPADIKLGDKVKITIELAQ